MEDLDGESPADEVDDVIGALRRQQAELADLLEPLADADWLLPSPCDGWDVADVVLHVAQTNELAIASATDDFAVGLDRLAGGIERAGSVDDGAAAMVAAERGAPGRVVRERWRASAGGQLAALAACDPHRRVVWVAGELSARTLATTRLAETWIHTGDVAAALGVTREPGDDRLRWIARLAWRTLPYAFGRAGRDLAGPVAFRLRGPEGAAWDFTPDATPLTVVEGRAEELCLVAARRVDAAATGLRADGPDGAAVLELVRTYA